MEKYITEHEYRRVEAARKEAERRRKRIEQEAMRRAEENLKNGVGGY